MQTQLRFKVSLAKDATDLAQDFYRACNRVTTLDPKDILVFGYLGERLVGIVRLCFEHDTYVLRTMQVLEQLQGKGCGRQILEKYKELLEEQGISEVFCMAYSHLEQFYGYIEFKKIDIPEAPPFLQNRVAEFYKKHPEMSVILMKRG